MDPEKSGEVLDASETSQQEETVMEKEVVSKLETPEESTEPEKPPAAGEEVEEQQQLVVNGHNGEVANVKETEELIVTETEEKAEMEVEESSPKEISKTEPVPDAVADDSSEKMSDPVAASEKEPENIQPEPENEPDPEPVDVQTPLAASAPEPEPEKVPEPAPAPEAAPPQQQQQEQTSPEPAVPQPPSQEEKKPEEAAEPERLKEAGDTTAAAEVAKEKKPEDVFAAEPPKEEEKPAEKVVVEEASKDKPTEAETVKVETSAASVEDKKQVEPEKPVESDPAKEAEAAPAEGEGVKAEPEKKEEEDPAPASGSLSFALLEREQTKDALRAARTLVVLRGLPGSGKSFLARAIADVYKDHCTVICADDHGVKPESPDSSAEGYKALDEAVVKCCSAGPTSALMIVVDDTNHTQDRLARLGEIAVEHHLLVIFLEPQTEWSRAPAELAKKTKRGLDEAQLETMKTPLEEMSLPLFFGWFLLSSVQDNLRCTSMDFLKTLDTLEAFKKHMIDFSGTAEKEVDLEQYYQSKGNLHCTTKFCDYGKAEGAKEYGQKTAVKELYGSTFELSLTALFVTPRTVGARVSLTEEQLLLWPDDGQKEAESVVPAAASLPPGSRAHITLGCAQGVKPVQTGVDLLDILALQQEDPVEEMELGSLRYYGEGRWMLNLREPICVPACFSSFYKPKKVDVTKKPEKKKKSKCTIL